MAITRFILPALMSMLMHGNSYAYDYDPLLLRAQATLFPKIVLLDQDINVKIKSKELLVLVLYAENDFKNAGLTKELIEKKYRPTNKNKMTVKLIKYDDFNGSMNATAYFLLKGPSRSVELVSSHAQSNKRITFSYDYNDFESNALLSVIMKEKTYIYLNKKALQDYGINFLPLFYKIVKVIE